MKNLHVLQEGLLAVPKTSFRNRIYLGLTVCNIECSNL